jgi:hypothetical protein
MTMALMLYVTTVQEAAIDKGDADIRQISRRLVRR